MLFILFEVRDGVDTQMNLDGFTTEIQSLYKNEENNISCMVLQWIPSWPVFLMN